MTSADEKHLPNGMIQILGPKENIYRILEFLLRI